MRLLILLLPLGLCACAGQLKEVGRAPEMSPVGYGLANQPRAAYPLNTFGPGKTTDYNSMWDTERENFFSDPRARRVGDVVTVKIAINDRASLDNTSDRSRVSSLGFGGDFSAGVDGESISGDATFGADSGSSSIGKGSIDRSENVEFSIAAVVVERLPNGNLIIAGSQEMRVNYEMRVVEVRGIVRPRDIGSDNTIPYDKIAEARVSYGGRGRLSEVQQPGWGQQVYDIVTPF
ncbi:flagellar basal body L-ring protein FlgH [Roseibium aestuarii]|uniref:Flagellar L-ring protein n=1 Tax=Roseibium aestuarii TaxID=2600299 RepID=A0ABW4JUK1_9HYPH|nr:flagellar basal body L-ring protein FlgH [Roseibium aestuarii]